MQGYAEAGPRHANRSVGSPYSCPCHRTAKHVLEPILSRQVIELTSGQLAFPQGSCGGLRYSVFTTHLAQGAAREVRRCCCSTRANWRDCSWRAPPTRPRAAWLRRGWRSASPKRYGAHLHHHIPSNHTSNAWVGDDPVEMLIASVAHGSRQRRSCWLACAWHGHAKPCTAPLVPAQHAH